MADADDFKHSLTLAKAALVAPAGARARVWESLGHLAQQPSPMAASHPPGPGSSALQNAGAQGSVSTTKRAALGGSGRTRAWTATLMGISFIAGYWLGETPAHPVLQSQVPGGAEPQAARLERPEATVASEAVASEAVASEAVASEAEPGSAAPVGQEHTALDEQRSDSHRARHRGKGASRPATAAVDRAPADARPAVRVAPRTTELERPAADRTVNADGLASADSLAGEVALLQRVERAIRAGEGELALTLLVEHERDYPVSPLREERAAARVLAACVARGSDASASERARAAAQRFLAGRALSVYADRIRTLCGLNSGSEPEKTSNPGH